MKKLLSLFIAAAISFVLCAAVSAEEDLSNYYITSSLTFGDCPWVLLDREVERGSVGDVDSDGYITTGDAVYILRYMAGWDLSGYTIETHGFEFSEDSADVTNDGRVNATDAAMILKYAAGWFETGVMGGNENQNLLSRWITATKENPETPPYFRWLSER